MELQFLCNGFNMQMNDPSHLEKFNHNYSLPLEENISKSENVRSQHVDFFLVLDLEGKVEILEFPVIMIDAKTMQVVDGFHRFCFLTKFDIILLPFFYHDDLFLKPCLFYSMAGHGTHILLCYFLSFNQFPFKTPSHLKIPENRGCIYYVWWRMIHVIS